MRLASVPAGAKVVDNVDGQLLGMTPLVLTRPRGGTLTLRFEKDGYSASTRTMALDGDRAFELTLEQKPKKRERKPREPSNEPAKLRPQVEEARPCSRNHVGFWVVRQGARVSLILAFVFPAIVCAAVALAYYGYRYAVASSVRSKASLMEGNQQLAQLAVRQDPGPHRPGRRRAVRGGGVGRSGAGGPVVRSTCPPASSRSWCWTTALRIRSVVPVARSGAPPARAGALGRATSRGWSGSRCSRGRPATPATFATCTSCSRASRC